MNRIIVNKWIIHEDLKDRFIILRPANRDLSWMNPTQKFGIPIREWLWKEINWRKDSSWILGGSDE